jgi:hypothetical protein
MKMYERLAEVDLNIDRSKPVNHCPESIRHHSREEPYVAFWLTPSLKYISKSFFTVILDVCNLISSFNNVHTNEALDFS